MSNLEGTELLIFVVYYGVWSNHRKIGQPTLPARSFMKPKRRVSRWLCKIYAEISASLRRLFLMVVKHFYRRQRLWKMDASLSFS